MKRYQECGILEKAYRWLRHMPLSYLSFCWWLVKWPFTGFDRDRDFAPLKMEWVSCQLAIYKYEAEKRMVRYNTYCELMRIFEEIHSE